MTKKELFTKKHRIAREFNELMILLEKNMPDLKKDQITKLFYTTMVRLGEEIERGAKND